MLNTTLLKYQVLGYYFADSLMSNTCRLDRPNAVVSRPSSFGNIYSFINFYGNTFWYKYAPKEDKKHFHATNVSQEHVVEKFREVKKLRLNAYSITNTYMMFMITHNTHIVLQICLLYTSHL